MNQKPSDLLLNVVDFFGILIPGAILAYLHGEILLKPFGLSMSQLKSPADWIPAFFISFVLGHFLLGFSVPLNGLANRFPSKETQAYEKAVRLCLTLPLDVPGNRANVFYSAYSFVRLHSSQAIAEVERQAAEYKLFRSLALLFSLDILLSIFAGLFSWPRLIADLIIVCLAAYRFQWLLDWTYYLTFDFYLQLQEAKPNRPLA